MKTMRIITSSFFAACCGLALAQYSSPELMLVADQGGVAGSGHPSQIERYDPYTGAYLGAFGAGYLRDATGVNVIGQDAYVTDSLSGAGGIPYSRIDKFNFSTGAYDGSIFNQGPFQLSSTATYGGNIIASDLGDSVGGDPGYVWTLSPTGQSLGRVALPATQGARSATIVGNQLWVTSINQSQSIGGGVLVYNLNPDGTINGGPALLDSAEALGYLGGATATINGTQYFYSGGINAFNSGIIDKWTTGGAFAGEEFAPNALAGYSLAAGHNGMIYSLDLVDNAVDRYDGGASFGYGFGSSGAFALSESFLPDAIAVYAAPEPVTMVGLSLGVFGLIARRRRRN